MGQGDPGDPGDHRPGNDFEVGGGGGEGQHLQHDASEQ